MRDAEARNSKKLTFLLTSVHVMFLHVDTFLHKIPLIQDYFFRRTFTWLTWNWWNSRGKISAIIGRSTRCISKRSSFRTNLFSYIILCNVIFFSFLCTSFFLFILFWSPTELFFSRSSMLFISNVYLEFFRRDTKLNKGTIFQIREKYPAYLWTKKKIKRPVYSCN